jgi:hypothetical protein
MTARAATLGLALAALFAFEALAVTSLQVLRTAGEPDYLRLSWFTAAAPWLLIATLYAIAAWRVTDGSNAARWLSIVAAMLAAPLAVNFTTDIEPAALWIFRPLACAIAPWLAIVHPPTSRVRIGLAAVNVVIEVAAAGVTLAILIAVATNRPSEMTGLLAYLTVSLISWPWIVPGAILLSALVVDPLIDALVLGILATVVIVRSARARRTA